LSAEFQQRILSDFAQAATQHRESFDLDLRALNAFLVSMPWHSFVDSLRIALLCINRYPFLVRQSRM
jgi:hypothetical protein